MRGVDVVYDPRNPGGADPAFRAAVAAAAAALGKDLAKLATAHPIAYADTGVVGGHFSSACYIDSSLPALLFLAYKYAGNAEAAVVANTNAGGENCHRGAALGALMGLRYGDAAWPTRWTDGFADAAAIRVEADAFTRLACFTPTAEAAVAPT